MWWPGPTLQVEAETRCRNPRNWSSRPRGFRNTCWQNLDEAGQSLVWGPIVTELHCSPHGTEGRSRQASAVLSVFSHAWPHPVAGTTDSQSTRPHKGSSVPPGCAGGTCPRRHQLTGAFALQTTTNFNSLLSAKIKTRSDFVQCYAKLALRWTWNQCMQQLCIHILIL